MGLFAFPTPSGPAASRSRLGRHARSGLTLARGCSVPWSRPSPSAANPRRRPYAGAAPRSTTYRRAAGTSPTHGIQGRAAGLGLQAGHGRRCDEACRLCARGRLLAAEYGTHGRKAPRPMTISHAAAQVFRFWRWLWQSDAIMLLMFVPALVLWMIIIIQVDPSPSIERRKACDQAVDALLNSRDLVEVQRAGILIDQLNCSVARRLPQP